MNANRGLDSTLSDNKKGPITRVVIDRALCIGAGNCCGIAPDLFSLDDEQKAVLVSQTFDDPHLVIDAAWSCPTDAISVFGSDGRRIYPPPDRRSYLNL
jgi:ferredoxin